MLHKLTVKKNYSQICLQLCGWAIVYLVIVGSLQYQIPYPFDDDTAYHAVVGQLIKKYGLLHSFPWTPFSLIAEQYADKELLFHLLFVPFAGFDWITAARIVGTIAGVWILLTIYLLLRAEGVRCAGFWALIPLTGSVLFLYRFVLVRPHLLSISLALIFLWAAARQRLVILAIVSALFPWSYVAFWQIPLLLLLASESARFLSGERIRWRPSAVVITGILVGLAFHPNTMNLLRVNWMHMAEVLFKSSWGGRPGFDLGGEFAPYPVAGWIQGLLFSVIMLITATVFAWRNRRDDTISLVFALAALGFCILTVKTARFAEYFVPFSVAALALSMRTIHKPRLLTFLPVGIISVTLAWLMWVQPTMIDSWRKWPNDMPPNVAAVLQQNIPIGAQVFTTDWAKTGLLMLTLPDRRFMVQLDPTFFYMKDPELYKLWYLICHEAPPDSAESIRRRFGARYVLGFNTTNSRRLFERLKSEPGVRMLLASDTWMLFDLGTP